MAGMAKSFVKKNNSLVTNYEALWSKATDCTDR